jgi:P27 family predicted phage terminase small subunit
MPKRGGRRPKPTGLRLLQGEHLERINEEEPLPPPGLPSVPDLSPVAQEVWDATAPRLLAMGCLAVTDGDPLAAYCEAVAVMRRSAAILARSDVLISSAQGRPMRNPALAALRDASHTMLAYAREFGLTPSSRTLIKTPPDFRDAREELLS